MAFHTFRPSYFLTVAACAAFLSTSCFASSVNLPFSSCSPADSTAGSDLLLEFTSFYGQFDVGQDAAGQWGREGASPVFRLVGMANVGAESLGYSPETGFLATVVASSEFLSYGVYNNNSALCDSIRTSTGLGCIAPDNTYGPGALAFGLEFDLNSKYPLSTIRNRIRVLDTSNPSQQIACYDVDATPFYPQYFAYVLILWFTVALVIGYIVVPWIARIWAAKSIAAANREAELASSLTAKIGSRTFRQSIGPVFWEAASGATLQASASLRRFATPTAREVLWIVQALAVLGLISVNWPDFVYPITSKAAWSLLAYNVTLTQSEGDRIDPLQALSNDQFYTNISSQMADGESPLYQIDALPNVLLDVSGASAGIERFARVVGLRPQDLFGICATLFMCLIGGAILVSLLFLALDVLSFVLSKNDRSHSQSPSPTQAYRPTTADGYDRESRYSQQPSIQETGKIAARWWQTDDPSDLTKSRPSISLINHASLLMGNCLRLLLFFHLPLVIFSTYQISLLHSTATTVSVALAVLVLVVICILVPAIALFKIWRTSEGLLQDHYPTLLALGPMYNVFGERSYCFMMVRILGNLAVGITIGAAQGSGTAQAVVILVFEIIDTLVTSLWLPWGDGAVMGPLAFLFSVGRIITAVLLIVLSPAVSIDDSVAGWIAYVAIGIQLFLILFLFFVLLVKIFELLFRAFGKVPFDESRSAKATGLGGALRRWDRNGQNTRGKRSRRTRTRSQLAADEDLVNTRPVSRQRLSSYGDGRSDSARPMIMQDGRPDSRHTRHLSAGSYGDYYAPSASANHAYADDYDDGFIMSAMSSGPWLMTQQQQQQQQQHQGYVQPGSYSAMPQNQMEDLANGHDQPQSTSGFAVVRGGRATDQNPYTLSSNIPGAHGLADKRRSQSSDSEYFRSSSDYFSMQQQNQQPQPTRPAPPTLLSNSTHNHIATPSSPVQQAADKKPKGFFGRFGRPARSNSFDSSDDDDEESPANQRKRRLWPFSKDRRTALSGSAIEEDEDESAEPVQQSFQVIRKPRATPAATSDAEPSSSLMRPFDEIQDGNQR